MSTHCLCVWFDFSPEDRSDPESQSHCELGDIMVDNHKLDPRAQNDQMVNDFIVQAIMRIHNLQPKVKP